MKIGVLGLGFMGSTHLQGLARIARDKVEVAAVMDANTARLTGDLSGVAGNLDIIGQVMDFSGMRKYTCVDEILADRDLDAVDICLPTNFHAPVTIEALRAGKHVLCEKPMALTGAQADQMREEAEKQNRVLMIAQVLRFFPAYVELAGLVRSGQLGPIRAAFFRRRTAVPTWGPWEMDKKQSGGGVFDLLIHDVDMSLYLFGRPEAVSASGYENLAGGIDQITGQFHYPSIGSVTIDGGWYHLGEYPFSMEFTVTGDRGVVEYSSAGRPPTVYWADGKKQALQPQERDAYQAEIEYFVDCVLSGRQPEQCMPGESAAAVKAMLCMMEAREKGERLPCRL